MFFLVKDQKLNKIIFSTLLWFAGAALFVLIIFVKSKTIPDFYIDPILYSYAIFVTIFLMFRIGGAIFFEESQKKLFENKETIFFEPKITFVIPCKNEEKAIHNTVSQCFKANYPKDKIEVIIINDGSTDGTYQILEKMKKEECPELIIVNWEKNRGKRHGMTEGFRLSSGEIIIQLDSDSYIEPNDIRNLIRPFMDQEIGAVCAHADPQNSDENMITKIQASYYYISFRIMKAAESTFSTVFCCSGCSSAYRKSAVMPVIDQWLNEKFLGKIVTYGDDRALTSWILKNGHKTVYTDLVQAYTIVPNNPKQLFVQQLRWKKSWIINSFFTGKFIYKKQLFVALFYYYPLIILSYVAPIMAFRSLIYIPLTGGSFPFFYFLGVLMVTILVVYIAKIYDNSENRRHLGYFFLWQAINTIFFSYIIFYAAIKIRDRSWGTR